MAISVKSLEEMFRDVIPSLQAGLRGRPVFALLLGSGFSYPIVPTPTQMLRSDIAWWRFCNERRLGSPFRQRADVIAEGKCTEEEVADFERETWKNIYTKFENDEKKRFPLGENGLPDLTDPENVGRAYQAVMSHGLLNNRMRRQYLRDAIDRSGRKVNSAHIFLAGILEAQEQWAWGAPFCRTIFTTNFDPLLQRSLQLVNKLYYMTDRPGTLEAPDDDQSEAIHLVYTHGSVHRYELLNTGDQIDKARKQNAPNLVEYFEKHGVIVIGYSGWRDTTMTALLSCSSFDSNLYWCDIHPAAQAEARLRPEVLELLHAGEKNAYYVPIPSADEALRQLHRVLKLGDVPKFILTPVGTVIDQLKSIEVPAGTTAPDGTAKALADDMATLLSNTLSRLEAAKRAFDDPSIVKASSEQEEDELAKALIAQLVNDAFVAYSQGRTDDAIALLSAVIDTAKVPEEDRVKALYNRGVTYGDKGMRAEAIADYTALIGMQEATTELKADALVNRGLLYNQQGKLREETDDYTAVIEMADVPPKQQARALIARGWSRFSTTGDARALIDDSRQVLALAPDNPYARMNLALGLLLTAEVEAAITEYHVLRSLASEEAVLREAVGDLQAQLKKQPDLPGAARALAVLTNVGETMTAATDA
jgi:tetratricopeptide (TPR) repeat protein